LADGCCGAVAAGGVAATGGCDGSCGTAAAGGVVATGCFVSVPVGVPVHPVAAARAKDIAAVISHTFKLLIPFIEIQPSILYLEAVVAFNLSFYYTEPDA
jgi:hypothetical protein